MILFITTLLLNSFYIIGLSKASEFDWVDDGRHELGIIKESKMIFWRLRYWSIKYIGEFWSKPLFTCPPCMASFHSLYFYWFFFPFTIHNLVMYIFYIPILSFVNWYLANKL